MKEAKALEAKATDCVECARDERKKKEKITKYVNERYDAKFKEIQNYTNGTNVWGGGAGAVVLPKNPNIFNIVMKYCVKWFSLINFLILIYNDLKESTRDGSTRHTITKCYETR